MPPNSIAESESKSIDIMALVRKFESEVWLEEPSLKTKIRESKIPTLIYSGPDKVIVENQGFRCVITFKFSDSTLVLATPTGKDAMGILIRSCTDEDIKDFIEYAIMNKDILLANIQPDLSSIHQYPFLTSISL